jgi:class I fructose-bisphosphate aldolase
MDEALRCGAAGLCVGRNIFQNADPLEALDQIISLVHEPRAEEPSQEPEEAEPAQNPVDGD